MPNINDLRENLMAELSALMGAPTAGDLARIGAKCEIADRIIDTMRVEVQLAAVLKGAMEVPFIEGQTAERPNRPAQLPAPEPVSGDPTLTPIERTAKMLASGPAPNHPWRIDAEHSINRHRERQHASSKRSAEGCAS